MPALDITVDLGDVEEGLAAMEHRARALGPTLHSLAKPMKDDQRNHKVAKEGPDGAWPARAASTIARAHGKRKLPRSPLGRLPTAVKWDVGPSSISGTSKVRWSGAHQDGDRVGRGSKLPARPFLWLSDEFVNLARGELAGALVAAYGGH